MGVHPFFLIRCIIYYARDHSILQQIFKIPNLIF